MEMLLLAIGFGLIVYAVYKWAVRPYSYWQSRNVKFLKPTPFFGNTGGFLMGKYSLIDFANLLYSSFPNEKVFGIFDFQHPLLVIRDPEVVKQLVVKDFDYFENHRKFIDERGDILFGNSLFMMRGEKWRDMRANLSPAFTSSKMRQMYDLIGDTAFDMVEYFKVKTGSGQELHAEMKELFSKYTNDVIATAAFGIKVNSFEDDKNEFYTTGSQMLNFTGFTAICKLLMIRFVPSLMQKLGIQFLNGKASKFFKRIILETMQLRTEQKIFRPDMINMLMQLKSGKATAVTAAAAVASSVADATKEGFSSVEESSVGQAKVTRKWNDDELVAQCFLFFLGGFDTSSSALMMAAYELARNPDAQEHLYAEVAEADQRLGGKRLPYDELQRMRYLDQVISESLRLWAPASVTDRECNKDYQYNDGTNKFTITKGTALWIPIHSYHHDEKYFPNPTQFNPDRFSEEEKHKIQPGTYLPFGVGPRNCIASRFALMEVKTVLYYLVLNFKFVPNAETQIPLKLAKNPTSFKTERGVHLQLVPRS